MIKPPIEDLLKETPGRFALVITSAKRAKDINSYFNQLGEGIGAYTPPQALSRWGKTGYMLCYDSFFKDAWAWQ